MPRNVSTSGRVTSRRWHARVPLSVHPVSRGTRAWRSPRPDDLVSVVDGTDGAGVEALGDRRRATVAEQADLGVRVHLVLEERGVGDADAGTGWGLRRDQFGVGRPAEGLALGRQEVRVPPGLDALDGGGGGRLRVGQRILQAPHRGPQEVLGGDRVLVEEVTGRDEDTERPGDAVLGRVEQVERYAGPLELTRLVALVAGEADDALERD